MPSAIVTSTSMAVSVPSRFAPSVTRCVVAVRLPASVCSPSRSRMQRTGRPSFLASAAAVYVACGAPFFAPNPPPM